MLRELIKGTQICPLNSSSPCSKGTHLCDHKSQKAHNGTSHSKSHNTSSIGLAPQLSSTSPRTWSRKNLPSFILQQTHFSFSIQNCENIRPRHAYDKRTSKLNTSWCSGVTLTPFTRCRGFEYQRIYYKTYLIQRWLSAGTDRVQEQPLRGSQELISSSSQFSVIS